MGLAMANVRPNPDARLTPHTAVLVHRKKDAKLPGGGSVKPAWRPLSGPGR
jgi:hypothetical protein